MASSSNSYNSEYDGDTEEDYSDAVSYYVDDANRDPQEHTPDRDTPITPQKDTSAPIHWDRARSGALSKEELPDSEDLNVKESSSSFESVRTVIIPGGTKITPKPQPKYVSLFSLFRPRFFQHLFSTPTFYHLSLMCAR